MERGGGDVTWENLFGLAKREANLFKRMLELDDLLKALAEIAAIESECLVIATPLCRYESPDEFEEKRADTCTYRVKDIYADCLTDGMINLLTEMAELDIVYREDYDCKIRYDVIHAVNQNTTKPTSTEKPQTLERRRMTKHLRYEVLKRDGFRCRFCGATADDGAQLHVDHIIPISKGGRTEIDNLQTLCLECNLGKGVDVTDC